MKKSRRRYISLLEVLIAFALIVMCIIPLISPHVNIHRAQVRFGDEVELDHVVSLLYGEMTRRMYRQEIPFQELLSPLEKFIDNALIVGAGYAKPLPFRGTYRFEVLHRKGDDPPTKELLHLKLVYDFYPLSLPKDIKDEAKQKLKKTFSYEIVVGHLLGEASAQEEEPLEHEDEDRAVIPKKGDVK